MREFKQNMNLLPKSSQGKQLQNPVQYPWLITTNLHTINFKNLENKFSDLLLHPSSSFHNGDLYFGLDLYHIDFNT